MGLRNPPTASGRAAAIEFIHHRPKLLNLGDALCSPKNYYRFVPNRHALAVYGGGAFQRLAVELASEDGYPLRIMWAVGVSHQPDNPIDLQFASVARLFHLASTRDPEIARNGLHLVPCPSVFHPVCDLDPGGSVGLFLNASRGATGSNAVALLDAMRERHPNLITGSNAMQVKEFMAAFAKTQAVVTNSYHAAYWSLLSGRSVTLIGYSSKFTSLMDLFGKDRGDMLSYRKGDQKALSGLVGKALDQPDRTRIVRPDETKLAFRQSNHEFASAVTNAGIVDAITPISPLLQEPASKSEVAV